MAIYKKLHLASGGGVISLNQQADQIDGTATILIGLGGTGIDCLKAIKEQIYKRLKPDNPNDLIPKYQHIEFMGVDTDDRSADFLDPGDFLNISYNGPLINLLRNHAAIDPRRELDWVRNDEIRGADLGGAGAGGVRQAGRLMMLSRAQEFASLLQQKINNAKLDLVAPKVYVHIFAGISGGTGAGSFLDACYITQDAIKGEQNSNIFGYVFLPDVNISKGLDAATQEYVKKNGYACLQEIDYCMNLEKNGGAFQQQYYPGKIIDWKQPPVDMCHLVSATNSAGEVIPQAYQYAMHVVTEYIMDFLTYTADNRFTITSSLSNFTARVSEKDNTKIRGYNLAYCGLGAACATLPLTEINTYLASQLFEDFANLSQAQEPSEQDIDQLAIDILAPGARTRAELYSRIMAEVRNGDPSNDFEFYEGDYRDLLPNNNRPFIIHYTDQRARKLGVVKTNVEGLQEENNGESYLARMKRSLQRIICGDDRNPAKGPAFARDMLDAAKDYNLINIIQGLQRENEERKNQEAYNFENVIYPDYQRAEKDFLNKHKRSIMDNDKKRFQDYENATRNEVRSAYDIRIYNEIDGLLDTFQRQIQASLENFYRILARVMGNLNETFQENAAYLASYDQLVLRNPFYIPMMTIEDLEASMDAEIRRLNLPKMFQVFLQGFYDHQEDWVEEDERKIARFVTLFLTEKVFAGFASRNITAFLKDKYNNPASEVLIQNIYNHYISKIAAKANPLFPIDGTVLDIQNVAMLSHFSIPVVSAEILAAANQYATANATVANPIGVNQSNQTDRIYMLRNSCAFPVGSYARLNEYENQYFHSIEGHYGRHYYEGERKGKKGRLSHMKFSNWRELPPLRPFSNLTIDENTPREMARILIESEKLYDRGMELGVIGKMSDGVNNQHDDKIYTIDKKIIQTLEEKVQALEKEVEKPNQESIANAKNLIPEIENLLKTPLTPTGESLFREGFGEIEDQERIRRDYFITMPAKYGIIREGIQRLEKIEEYRKRLADCQTKLQEYEKERIKKDKEDFFHALFTGILHYEGIKIDYTKEEYGIKEFFELTAMDPKFPFSTIPPYQAFISYCELPDEIKQELKDQYFEKMRAMNQELKDYAKELEDRMKAQAENWQRIARNMSEAEEIRGFIIEIFKEIQNHRDTIQFM